MHQRATSLSMTEIPSGWIGHVQNVNKGESRVDELMVVNVGEMTNVRLSTLFWILASQQQAISTFLSHRGRILHLVSVPLQTNNLGGVSAFLNWPPRSPMKLTLLCAEEKLIQTNILGGLKIDPVLCRREGARVQHIENQVEEFQNDEVWHCCCL